MLIVLQIRIFVFLVSPVVLFCAFILVLPQSVGTQSIRPGPVPSKAREDILKFPPQTLLTGDETVAKAPCNGPVFTTGKSFPANGSDITFVTSGDLNNDSKPDAVVVDLNGTMSSFLGNGVGDLSRIETLSIGGGPALVNLGYMDADGNLDAVVMQRVTNTISVFRGDGTGHFVLASILNTTLQPSELRIGDANNDGKLDIIFVASSSDFAVNKIGVFFANGDATFSPSIDTSVSNPYPHVNLVLGVGDFNLDGNLDVLDRTRSSTRHWSGNGTGTFVTTWSSNAGYGPIAVDDLNGDGKLDFVTSDFFSRVVVFTGNGNGTFQVVAPPIEAGG